MGVDVGATAAPGHARAAEATPPRRPRRSAASGVGCRDDRGERTRSERALEAASKWKQLCIEAERERDDTKEQLRLALLGKWGGSSPSGSPLEPRVPLSPRSGNGGDAEPGTGAAAAAARGDGDAREEAEVQAVVARVAPVEARRAPAEDKASVSAEAAESMPGVASTGVQAESCTDAEAETLRAELEQCRERCAALTAEVAAQSRARAVAEESAEAAELECAALHRAHRQELDRALASARGAEDCRTGGKGHAAKEALTPGVELQRHRLRMVLRMQQRWAMRRPAVDFHVWVQHAHERGRQRRVVRRAVAALQRRAIDCALLAWREGVERQQLRRRAVVSSLRRRQLRGVSWAFWSWLTTITQVRDRQLRASATLLWDRHEADEAGRDALLRRVSESLGSAGTARRLHECLFGWRELASAAALDRQRGLYAARRIRCRWLAVAWARWQKNTAEVKTAAGLVARAVMFSTRRTLASVLGAWSASAVAVRQQVHSERRAAAVVRRLLARQLCQAFAAWARSVTRAHLDRQQDLVAELERAANDAAVAPAPVGAAAAVEADRLQEVEDDRLAGMEARLLRMEQRAMTAESVVADAEANAAEQKQQIRKLQRRLKELTLAGGKHALELKRQQAQREISLCR